MECGLAIQILPLDAKNDEEVIYVVDQVIAYLASTGLNYSVGAFETTIEGSYQACMEALSQCCLIAQQAGCRHVMCYAKIDYAPTGVLTTSKKLAPYTYEN